jgi:hypothetical protein
LPSFSRKKEMASRDPNLGTRLKPTPMRRGPSPDRDAAIGAFLNACMASWRATVGSCTLPFRSTAYCCTSCLNAVTGLSTMVWKAEPPRYAT